MHNSFLVVSKNDQQPAVSQLLGALADLGKYDVASHEYATPHFLIKESNFYDIVFVDWETVYDPLRFVINLGMMIREMKYRTRIVVANGRTDPRKSSKRKADKSDSSMALTVRDLFLAGACDYFESNLTKEQLSGRVNEALNATNSELVNPPLDEGLASVSHRGTDSYTLVIKCSPGDKPHVEVKGPRPKTYTSIDLLHLEVDEYSRLADNIFDNTPKLPWRFLSKQVGRLLDEALFAQHRVVLKAYHETLGEVRATGKDGNLYLRFEQNRVSMRIPLECLFVDDTYLVLRHPFSRYISGVSRGGDVFSPDVVRRLRNRGEALRILLIASNTPPNIPAVDREIEDLAKSLEPLFANYSIKAEVTPIRTDEATYKYVKDALQRRSYDIVHYAGHGVFRENSSEESSLVFWERPQRQGDKKEMKASELGTLLSRADVRFVYLSCCQGAATGSPANLLDDDFLGIAEAVIQEGVPAVLGYRWPVSDGGALTLAKAFYRSLAEKHELDVALLDARHAVATTDRNDITWLSPILIMQ